MMMNAGVVVVVVVVVVVNSYRSSDIGGRGIRVAPIPLCNYAHYRILERWV